MKYDTSTIIRSYFAELLVHFSKVGLKKTTFTLRSSFSIDMTEYVHNKLETIKYS